MVPTYLFVHVEGPRPVVVFFNVGQDSTNSLTAMNNWGESTRTLFSNADNSIHQEYLEHVAQMRRTLFRDRTLRDRLRDAIPCDRRPLRACTAKPPAWRRLIFAQRRKRSQHYVATR